MGSRGPEPKSSARDEPRDAAEDDGYRTQSPDTSREAEDFLFAAYRRMEPWEKMHLVCELTRAAKTVAMAGLRERHPRASERELELRLAVLRYGPELVKEAFGWVAPENDERNG